MELKNSTSQDEQSVTVKLTTFYLAILTMGMFFPCTIIALVVTFFLLDPSRGFIKIMGLGENTGSFFLLFFPILIALSLFLFIYFSSQQIVLTDNELIFKRLFTQKKIPLDAIVDFSRRYYYGSPFEAIVSASIEKSLGRPVSNGLVLELWYKDGKKMRYFTHSLSNYQDSETIFSRIAQRIEIPEKFDPYPRTYFFYMLHHKLYSLTVFFTGIFCAYFVLWCFENQADLKVLLLIPCLFFYYYFSRGFLART